MLTLINGIEKWVQDWCLRSKLNGKMIFQQQQKFSSKLKNLFDMSGVRQHCPASNPLWSRWNHHSYWGGQIVHKEEEKIPTHQNNCVETRNWFGSLSISTFSLSRIFRGGSTLSTSQKLNYEEKSYKLTEKLLTTVPRALIKSPFCKAILICFCFFYYSQFLAILICIADWWLAQFCWEAKKVNKNNDLPSKSIKRSSHFLTRHFYDFGHHHHCHWLWNSPGLIVIKDSRSRKRKIG